MGYLTIFRFIVPALLIIIACPSFAEPKAEPYWTYDSDYTGQEDWGALPGYEICRHGFAQSPVNIGSTKTTDMPKLDFKYKESDSFVILNDKAILTKVSNGGELNIGDKKYTLDRIELHTPGGHHIRSQHYPLEIHLLHKDSNGKLLIVAVFAVLTDENTAIANILEASNNKKLQAFKLDANALLPQSRGYFSYVGSIPYPPCSEGVEWRVMKEPISVSKEQLKAIARYVKRNTRVIQPLYMREVMETSY